MFTLRKYTEEGVEINQEIGREYTFIRKETNPEDFARTFESYFKRPPDTDVMPDNEDATLYGFICNGSFIQPLFNNQTAYIMSESGQTFANVSFR